jgi:hypothetical protein
MKKKKSIKISLLQVSSQKVKSHTLTLTQKNILSFFQNFQKFRFSLISLKLKKTKTSILEAQRVNLSVRSWQLEVLPKDFPSKNYENEMASTSKECFSITNTRKPPKFFAARGGPRPKI